MTKIPVGFTVPWDAVREIVVMADAATVALSADYLGDAEASEATGQRDALIKALSIMLGDTSTTRRAISTYLYRTLGTGKSSFSEIVDHIHKLGDM